VLGPGEGKFGIMETRTLLHEQAQRGVARFVGTVQDYRRKVVGKGDWHAVQAQIWPESMTELLGNPRLSRNGLLGRFGSTKAASRETSRLSTGFKTTAVQQPCPCGYWRDARVDDYGEDQLRV